MSKHIGSSWNPDRVAGSILNKERKEKTAKPVSTLKTYKTSELYTQLYGREAYEAWKAREAEITEMMHDRKRYSVAYIVSLREQNFRQMKEAGENLNKRVSSVKVIGSEYKKVA